MNKMQILEIENIRNQGNSGAKSIKLCMNKMEILEIENVIGNRKEILELKSTIIERKNLLEEVHRQI